MEKKINAAGKVTENYNHSDEEEAAAAEEVDE